MIGRLNYLTPKHSNVFYLRMLLTHNQSKGVTSEAMIRTIDGTIYATCKETYAALEILQPDQEWNDCIEEANLHASA